jgi:hypothetical protein
MRTDSLFTNHKPRVWSIPFPPASQAQRLPTLLAALVLALLFGLSAAPAAYAFPAEEPPACTVVGWGFDAFGQATPPDGLNDVVAIAAGGYSGPGVAYAAKTIDIAAARALPLGSTVTVKGTVTAPSGVFVSGTFDQGFAIRIRVAASTSACRPISLSNDATRSR